MIRRRLVSLVVALGFGLVACGGTDDGRPSGVPPKSSDAVDPCRAAEGYEFETLVDFDPPEGEMPEATRSQDCDPANPCTFNFNFDKVNTPPGNPPPGVEPPVCPEVQFYSDPTYMQPNLQGHSVGTRCGEPEYATRLVATNLAVCTNEQGRMGWGGSLSLTFANSASEAIDVSEWDGFSFWVKKASPATRSAFITAAVDNYTAGFNNIEDPFDDDRSCDSRGAPLDENGEIIPDTEKCDGFGVAITLADDWTFVPVRFAGMRQKGFGMPSHLGHLATDEFVRLQFLVSAGDWDVWIDDIAFFREPER